MHNLIISILTIIGLLHPTLVAAKDYKKLGNQGYAHWRCAAIGGLSLNEKDREQANVLFLSGHKILTDFISDLLAGKITDEDMKEVPIGIQWYITGGPSIEFRMGYMWAQFSRDAYDDTWPKLDNPDFDAQKNIQKMDAHNKFKSGNCHLL